MVCIAFTEQQVSFTNTRWFKSFELKNHIKPKAMSDSLRVRCDKCGKFISYDDIGTDKITIEYDAPRFEFGAVVHEEFYYYHSSCVD